MRKVLLVTMIIVFSCFLQTGCRTTSKGQDTETTPSRQLVVLCPKTFASVVKEVKPQFEKAHPGYTVMIEAAPIRPMMNDILKGKTGDIFLSTGDVELAHLYKKNLLRKETEIAFAETTIVALATKGNPLKLQTITDLSRPQVMKISIPDPKFNSAGAAFVEAARRKGVYEKIEGRLYLAPGPKMATEQMDQGKADVSITYSRCYYGHAKDNALIEFVPTELHEPITCKAVALESCSNLQAAKDFIKLLLTDENQDRFERAYFRKIRR